MSSTVTAPVPRTALQAKSPVNGAMSIRELPLSGKLNVRGRSEDAAFAAALSASAGGELPVAINARVEQGGIRLLCTGPDEWLLQVPLDGLAAEQARLQAAFAGMHAAVVDVSDYFTVIELGGIHTRDVLAKLTPLDVTSDALPAGTFRQTRMAKCSVLLAIQSDHCARLQVRWSHAEYLWDYLAEACREYNT